MNRIGWVGMATIGLIGCINGGSGSAFPLYEGARRPSGDVATLTGDVELVDDKSVSEHGKHFELEPGCHTVTNVATWGGFDPSAAVMAHVPQVRFAIDMKAGMNYVLQLRQVGAAGSGGRIEIAAFEQDAAGNVTRRFERGSRCFG